MARGQPHGSSGRVFCTAPGYAAEPGRLGLNAAGKIQRDTLWVPKTYATRRYWWMTPPARSCRRTRK